MKKSFPLFLILLLMSSFTLLAQNNEIADISQQVPTLKNTYPKLVVAAQKATLNTSSLNQSFKKWEAFKIDFSELKRMSKEKDIFEIQLELGDQQWNLVLLYHDLRAANSSQKTIKNNKLIELPKTRAITFKGYVNGPHSSGEPARFNISDRSVNGYVTLNGQEYFMEALSTTDPTADEDYFVVYRPQDYIENEEHPCTVQSIKKQTPHANEDFNSIQRNNSNTLDCIEVELATACTWDYVDALGGVAQANNRITAITNLMEGLFQPFNFTYTIVDQFAPATLADDPFTNSADASVMLASMQTFAQANLIDHDIGQLWTQRNIFGCNGSTTNFNLIGCARLRSVCRTIGYSVCENYSSSMNCLRTLSAHEIGHNWDGDHDVADANSIMRGNINCNATTFTPANTTRIQEFANTRTCLNRMGMGIEGTVLHHCNSDPIPDATVISFPINSQGCRFSLTDTDANGQYTQCTCNEAGTIFYVEAVKDGDDACGLSVIDLILIQNHILGNQFITNPYNLIAADVNCTESITVSDLLTIQRLILGNITSVPGCESWEFVDANYTFPNPSNPFSPPYPGFVNVQLPDSQASFVGIKKGDVNCSCDASPALTTNTSEVFLSSQKVNRGQEVKIDIKSNDLQALMAYQMGLHFDSKVLSFLEVSAGEVAGFSLDNFGLKDVRNGNIKAIWQALANDATPIEQGDVLFSLHFKALQDVSDTRKVISLDNDLLENLSFNLQKEQHQLNFASKEIENAENRSINTERTLSNLLVHPNPVNGNLVYFSFHLNHPYSTTLKVYDLLGKIVYQQKEVRPAGNQQIILEGVQNWSSGLYTYVLETDGVKKTGKIVVQ